jgi:hypothetical protein
LKYKSQARRENEVPIWLHWHQRHQILPLSKSLTNGCGPGTAMQTIAIFPHFGTSARLPKFSLRKIVESTSSAQQAEGQLAHTWQTK